MIDLQKIAESAFVNELEKISKLSHTLEPDAYTPTIKHYVKNIQNIEKKEKSEWNKLKNKYKPEIRSNRLAALGGALGGGGAGFAIGKLFGLPVSGTIGGSLLGAGGAGGIMSYINELKRPSFGKEMSSHTERYGEGAPNIKDLLINRE